MVAASFVISAAFAQDKPVKLSRTMKKDDVYKAKMVIVAQVMGNEATLNATIKQTVKEIKDNGHAVILETREDAKLNAGGMDTELDDKSVTTETRDKTGKLVDWAHESNGSMEFFSPEIARLQSILTVPVLADKEVKPGDSWDTELDNPAAKNKKVKLKTTFVGTEKVDGVELLKLKQAGEPEVDDAGAKMSYETVYWLQPASGAIVKAESTVKDLPTLSVGVISMTIKMTALKPDEAKKADK
jgi:hypothetical protein